jgi:hypothetical protein
VYNALDGGSLPGHGEIIEGAENYGLLRSLWELRISMDNKERHIGVCCITAQLRRRVEHSPIIIEKFRLKRDDSVKITPLLCSKWDKELQIEKEIIIRPIALF